MTMLSREKNMVSHFVYLKFQQVNFTLDANAIFVLYLE